MLIPTAWVRDLFTLQNVNAKILTASAFGLAYHHLTRLDLDIGIPIAFDSIHTLRDLQFLSIILSFDIWV